MPTSSACYIGTGTPPIREGKSPVTEAITVFNAEMPAKLTQFKTCHLQIDASKRRLFSLEILKQ